MKLVFSGLVSVPVSKRKDCSETSWEDKKKKKILGSTYVVTCHNKIYLIYQINMNSSYTGVL